MKSAEIYIMLLGDEEGTLRPTQAITLSNGLYKILPTSNYDPEDEIWEFLPGSIVKCEKRTYRGNDYLLAVEKIG
ncbi:unnamed protein product [Phaeothamnion confervicola]